MKRSVPIVAVMLVAVAVLSVVVMATSASAQTDPGCPDGEVCLFAIDGNSK